MCAQSQDSIYPIGGDVIINLNIRSNSSPNIRRKNSNNLIDIYNLSKSQIHHNSYSSSNHSNTLIKFAMESNNGTSNDSNNSNKYNLYN